MPPTEPTVTSLVEAYLPMAVMMARRCEGRGVDRDDLESEAQAALFGAATAACRPGRDGDGAVRDFKSYASLWIMGAMRKIVRDAPYFPIADVPDRLKRAAEKIRIAMECLAARGILRPTHDQIAGESLYPVDVVAAVMEIRGVDVRQSAVEWADANGRLSYIQGPELVPAFGAQVGFSPDRPCHEIARHPIAKDSLLCCMRCHESGMDHYSAFKKNPATDPRPEPRPKQHRPEPRPLRQAVQTRRAKRQLLFPPQAGGSDGV